MGNSGAKSADDRHLVGGSSGGTTPLPSNVVSASSSGGIPAWAASTVYALNTLVTNGGNTYICNTAHTSGSTFSGESGDWQQVGSSGGGTVTSVTAGDTSIVVGGTGAAPTVETGTLDVIATDHPPAAAWSNNSKKITGLALGVASTDAPTLSQALSALAFNVQDPIYGATGNGTTDDTTAIQAAITAAEAVKGCVFFPVGTYKITATLIVSGSCTLAGESAGSYYGGIASGSGIDAQNLPVATPFVVGAVVNMRTAATDAFHFTGAGQNVPVQNLAVQFGVSGDSVIFQNTGHGFVGIPPAYSTKYDQGLSGAHWNNVIVYGHDGNHYAYKFTNPNLNTFDHLSSFGGGGYWGDSNNTYDGSPGGYGNNVWLHPYFVVCVTGSAHAVERSVTQTILLERWYGPQVWMYVPAGTVAGLTLAGPSTSQRIWKDDSVGLGTTIDSPDWETNVSGGSQFTTDSCVVTGSFYFGNGVTSSAGFVYLPGGAQGNFTPGVGGTSAIISYSLPGQLSGYHSQSITTTAEAGLGTSPPAIVSSGATAMRGVITFGTGTSVPGGPSELMEFTIPAAAQGTVSPIVALTPMNAATVALGLYYVQINAQYLSIHCSTAPAASQANTIYAFCYMVMG